jgi:hypothetical protein
MKIRKTSYLNIAAAVATARPAACPSMRPAEGVAGHAD